MVATQFLVRNRHCNVWYGRIVIPSKLREHFNGKRELRKSLGTSDRNRAKRLALEFWIECQNGFDRVNDTPAVFVGTGVSTVLRKLHKGKTDARRPLAGHAKQFAHENDYNACRRMGRTVYKTFVRRARRQASFSVARLNSRLLNQPRRNTRNHPFLVGWKNIHWPAI
jgi:bifunctional DNA-binding transcriptional regulator/antitoxin component of YhaV-PrlF toxin-antitoxin module